MKATQAIATGVRKIDFIEQELAPLGPQEFLLKTLSVGLCHTDLPTYAGTLRETPSALGYMRSQSGVPDYPALIGHELTGVVEAVGSDVTAYKVGDYVTGMEFGAFATHHILSEKDPKLVRIPETDKKIKHILAEPLGCVVNVVREAYCKYGQNVAVVGCGFMGLMTIAGLRHAGAKQIVAIDLLDNKLELAKEMGADVTINPKREAVDDRAYELTDGRFFDVVVEISGSLKGLATATGIIKESHADGLPAFDGTFQESGRIILGGVYGNQEVLPINLAYDLVHRTPILISAYPTSAPRPHDNMREAVASMLDGRMPIEKVISHEITFSDIALGFELMENSPPDYIKGIVTF